MRYVTRLQDDGRSSMGNGDWALEKQPEGRKYSGVLGNTEMKDECLTEGQARNRSDKHKRRNNFIALIGSLRISFRQRCP